MKRIITGMTCLLAAMLALSCVGRENKSELGGDSQTDTLSEVVSENAEKTVQSLSKASDSLKNDPVLIERKEGLTIYYPQYSKIDLVCGKRPEKNDSNVIFIAEAAFTGELIPFKHSNIAGDHVSGGKREKGYKCTRNTGAFTWYSGTPKFLYSSYSKELDEAARKGGCGFGQEMMIHEGKVVKHKRPDGNVNEFRALCLIDGKVAVADSYGAVRFGDFIDSLLSAGATEALYLDMGPGWNYSWYRNRAGEAVEIHSIPIKYATNWITFYK
ncbi:MAG: hypothetical protein K2H76_08015 [Muribaculaceae bacterium]|nr:hypothetical protein [Muribaculaceae bacterium]